MSNDELYEELYIVAGAGGTLGREFLQALSTNSTNCVVACSRHEPSFNKKNVYWFQTGSRHFERPKMGEDDGAMSFPVLSHQFVAKKPSTITLIYPVGPFAFDAKTPKPQKLGLTKINSQIFGPNVIGVHNFLSGIQRLIQEWNERIPVRVVCFGSISNQFNPLFWQSYSLSKNVLRRYLRYTLSTTRTSFYPLSALFVNTSTINTGEENSIRPQATHEEKSEWLSCASVVNYVMDILPQLPARGFKETEFYYPTQQRPDYNSEEWFNRWRRQMSI